MNTREIKFRFWKHDIMCYDFGGFNESMGINEMFIYCNELEYPVMQYTGLKDKNGNDIYEGDILKREVKEPFYQVKMFNGCWIAEGANHTVLVFNISGISEAIGNIYEHKHLLEEKTKTA